MECVIHFTIRLIKAVNYFLTLILFKQRLNFFKVRIGEIVHIIINNSLICDSFQYIVDFRLQCKLSQEISTHLISLVIIRYIVIMTSYIRIQLYELIIRVNHTVAHAGHLVISPAIEIISAPYALDKGGIPFNI